jgi:hypothetical protein
MFSSESVRKPNRPLAPSTTNPESSHMTEPTWRRLDLFRRRLERRVEKLIAEAVSAGNIEMIRDGRIRLAAWRFAFEGSVEAHQQLRAFDFEDHRPLSVSDLRSILAIVEEPRVPDGTPLGLANPSPDDAKEFIFHVSAFVGALKNGAALRF